MRSHTGDTSYRSQGNERADQLANDAREHGRDAPLQPMLEGEEKVVFWSEDGQHQEQHHLWSLSQTGPSAHLLAMTQ